MELRKVESSLQDVLRVQTYKTSDNMQTIEAFMHSDMEIAEIVIPEGKYKSSASAASSLIGTIKRMHVGFRVVKRGNHIYLMKTTVQRI